MMFDIFFSQYRTPNLRSVYYSNERLSNLCFMQHAARNLETQDWVEVLQVIEHTMVMPYSLYVALLMWVQKQCGYSLVVVHKSISS
jgi:hypothetical protein